MRGKLIVVEGTDCSGKETQSNILLENLEKENILVKKFYFPKYDSPTGKIVGGPYLGKDYICDGWFPEGASNVDPKVSSLYYAADRKYNIKPIIDALNDGYNVIIDRYTTSNMAHQGGKIEDKNKRLEMYDWLHKLEFELLELPYPDMAIFLHMPYQYSLILKQNREEKPDQNEIDEKHLINAEKAYLELANLYDWDTIECVKNDTIRTIEDISEEVRTIVLKYLKKGLKNDN